MEATPTITKKDVQECVRCVLDTSDTPKISFDPEGVCNYCRGYEDLMKKHGGPLEKRTQFLDRKLAEIKAAGKGKRYDCLLGVSGGADSSYVAWWAAKNGLRPLVIHMDNGWNSELAVKNIENICKHLNFELHTHVINWEEFRDLQLAYLRASVIDIEALTDHAILAVIRHMAAKYKIRYTLSGFNYVTEAIMPRGWTHDKTDWSNIKDIARQHGGITQFKTFPYLSFWQSLKYRYVHKFESFRLLNYIDYDRDAAIKVLQDELDWRDYGGKHWESAFTKFYQAYILPQKFGVDKRKAHYATMINSGLITKAEAREKLKEPLYDDYTLNEEKEYVLKKFGLSETEFQQIMDTPPRPHLDFATDQRHWDRYFKFVGFFQAPYPSIQKITFSPSNPVQGRSFFAPNHLVFTPIILLGD